MTAKTIEISQSGLSVNREIAERNRARLDDAGIVSVNLMASPGAGKTSLIERTIRGMAGRLL
jgi:hydrogenase nickel incorporation protein HypB